MVIRKIQLPFVYIEKNHKYKKNVSRRSLITMSIAIAIAFVVVMTAVSQVPLAKAAS
jgi:amino acid permease